MTIIYKNNLYPSTKLKDCRATYGKSLPVPCCLPNADFLASLWEYLKTTVTNNFMGRGTVISHKNYPKAI